MRAARRPPAAAALLALLAATARADWVEISQMHYRKPLKPVKFTTHSTERTLLRNQSLTPSLGKGHDYRADPDPNIILGIKTENKRINPFLSRPNLNKKSNRIEIRRPSSNIEHTIRENVGNARVDPKEPENKRTINKTPNRVVFLNDPKAHTGVVEPVNKPEKQSSDTSVEKNRRADVFTSEEYESVIEVSSEEKNKHKFKGKVEPIKKPDKNLLPPKKNLEAESTKIRTKEIEKVFSITKASAVANSEKLHADSISNVKLIFEAPKSHEIKLPNAAQVNKIPRIKKPNRIYINNLAHTDRTQETDSIRPSTESHNDDTVFSSIEAEQINIQNTSTNKDRQPEVKLEPHHRTGVQHQKTELQQHTTKSGESEVSEIQPQDYSNRLHKDSFKRLDITNLEDFRDPEFVTKYETFEIEDDAKYPDVIVDKEPYDPSEPSIGEIYDDPSAELIKSTEVPLVEVKDFQEQNSSQESNSTISNETKPNPMENVIKLMKTVADTIAQNTRNSFKSKIDYLERLRDTIMSNIKARIDATWPDDGPPARRARQARSHVEFPSSEGALMTISFLTFAVFLIKLVLQVISTYKNKTMMVTPAVFAVSRAAAAAAAAIY